MVQTTVSQGCDYLGKIPANVKFLTEKTLEDGSYLSYIYPSEKLRKKGFQPLLVRVIEYTIEHPEHLLHQKVTEINNWADRLNNQLERVLTYDE